MYAKEEYYKNRQVVRTIRLQRSRSVRDRIIAALFFAGVPLNKQVIDAACHVGDSAVIDAYRGINFGSIS